MTIKVPPQTELFVSKYSVLYIRQTFVKGDWEGGGLDSLYITSD